MEMKKKNTRATKTHYKITYHKKRNLYDSFRDFDKLEGLLWF